MVNEQEEIKLGYLLDPCFELSNTAGKPLTNGWIEVYIHGTRNKYYCYSDFGGTLHPFKIPLDSLGSNIVLADPERAYDVYVYNQFGSLVMSRYNVSPGHAGGAAISSGGNAEHWIGRYGATIEVAANEYSDSIPLPIEPDYEGTFIDHISDNKNIVLKDGLYLVDCLLSFRQNPDSLNNTLGYVHVFTGLDDGESGVFQRNETLPDTDPDETHNIRVQFVRHVEGSTGCNVCFQVRTTNAWSFVRIQGLSIVKLGAGGGIAPQPIEYDAGQYISIENDVISVTGVQPAGNYADASSVSQGFYAVNQQLSALSGQINEVSGQIPSLDGYATQNWVNDQGFLKEVPSQYVTESELNSAVSGKADKSEIPSLEGYATEDWVRQQNYLTEVPSEYVTESELNSAISGKADKSEIPSLDGYATQEYVQSAVSGKQDELEFTYDDENKITTIDGHGIAGTGGGGGSGAVYTPGQYISIQNDIISVTGLQPSGDYQPAGDYLTQDDLNGYATDDDVQAAVSGKADKSEIPSLSGYATEEWVGQQGYMTSVPSEYITETELESELSGKADVSAIPSVAGLASETYVDQHIEEATSGKMDASAYIAPVNADWSATSGLSQILNKPTTEEVQFEELDLSSYVQQNDLSAYATHSEVVSATSGLQEQLTFSYNESNEISAINNSAIAGGGATYSGGQYIYIDNDTISVTGLQPQENADWNSTSGLSQILNKPSTEEVQFEELNLSAYATLDDVDEATSGKLDSSAYVAPINADWSATSGLSQILNKPTEKNLVPGTNVTITESGDDVIVNTTEIVSGLQMSAGHGVKLTLSGNNLIAGLDETLLWEGDASPVNGTTTGTYSEPISNFERIRIYWRNNDSGSFKCAEYYNTSALSYMGDVNSNGQWWKGINVVTNTLGFTNVSCWELTLGSPSTGASVNYFHLMKVVGINRIS